MRFGPLIDFLYILSTSIQPSMYCKPYGNDVGINVGNIDVKTRRLGGLDSQPSPGQSPRFVR